LPARLAQNPVGLAGLLLLLAHHHQHLILGHRLQHKITGLAVLRLEGNVEDVACSWGNGGCLSGLGLRFWMEKYFLKLFKNHEVFYRLACWPPKARLLTTGGTTGSIGRGWRRRAHFYWTCWPFGCWFFRAYLLIDNEWVLYDWMNGDQIFKWKFNYLVESIKRSNQKAEFIYLLVAFGLRIQIVRFQWVVANYFVESPNIK
jgi:hypothetical protein